MANAELIEKYRRLLRKLFPQGRAWDDVRQDDIGFLQGVAGEFARIDERAKDLLAEFNPATSTEMLEDWEDLLGLPDPCVGDTEDLNERRQQAAQKLAAVGGMSAPYFETVAESLGFDAIVTDVQEFRVGKSRVGDALTNPFDSDKDVFRVGRNRVGDELKTFGWRYIFEVNVEATVVEPFRVGYGRAGDPLVEFGNEILECTIARLKPAHTGAFFTFREVS